MKSEAKSRNSNSNKNFGKRTTKATDIPYDVSSMKEST